MRRALPLAALALIVVVAAPAGWATHDPNHVASGIWHLEFNQSAAARGSSATLQLVSVDKDAALKGVAAIDKKAGVPYAVWPLSQCGSGATQFYSGTFTRDTDTGPVVGCISQGPSGLFYAALYSARFKEEDAIAGTLGGIMSYGTLPSQPNEEFTSSFAGHCAGDGSASTAGTPPCAKVTLGYALVQPGVALRPGVVALGTTILLKATNSAGIPPGAQLRIYDRPQKPTAAPRSGYLIRVCPPLPCQVKRLEEDGPRTHAYRAVLMTGEVGTKTLKVIASSDALVLGWTEAAVRSELSVQTTDGGLFEPSATVPVGTIVKLRVDVKDPMPPGAAVFIRGGLVPGHAIVGMRCTEDPCTWTRYYKVPVAVSYWAEVIRTANGKQHSLGTSPPVLVTWAGH